MPVPAASVPAPALMREHAFTEIRRAIVDGRLEPGERLLDPELSRWLGVGRTPVREALARLAQTGLVRVTPGRGSAVSPLDVREALEAQTVAATLHAQAARDAVPLVTAAELDTMEQANADFADALAVGAVQDAIAADDAFHGVFVRAGANRTLAGVLETVTPLLRRMERVRFESLPGRRSVAQHRLILEAALAGDAEGCARGVHANWMSLRAQD